MSPVLKLKKKDVVHSVFQLILRIKHDFFLRAVGGMNFRMDRFCVFSEVRSKLVYIIPINSVFQGVIYS
jgi:hypothetical protein